MPQAQPRQHLKLQDSQMLQRQLMLKQFQELQKNRQFQDLADERQQNYLNQQSENFMSANTNFMSHGTYAAGQGFPNGTFSQPQTQDLFLMMPPEQPENTLYQTPIASSINDYNQHSHLQGQSLDSTIAFTKVSNNHAEKFALQSLHGKPFLGVNQNIFPGPHSSTDGAFESKPFTNGRNLFGQPHNNGFQQMNSFEQFQGKTTKIEPSQGAATLDPLEQKILFNMDGNGWTTSFDRNAEGYNNKLECSDYLSSFPAIQSGSWSALMQTAVGESSSDSGVVQEEWSGLSFQNTELSMDNQPSNNANVGNRQTDWIDNNIASALNGKSQAPFGYTNTSSGFPGFQFSNQQREGTLFSSSHECVQQSPKDGAKGLDGNSQQIQPFKGSQLNHTLQSPSGNAYPFQGFQLSDGNAEQRNIFAKTQDQTSAPPSLNSCLQPKVQQGNHNVTSAAGFDYGRNQHQKLYPSAAAVKTESPQVTSPNTANKLFPFDLFIPRGASQSNVSLDRVGQQFPILESVPVESSRRAPSPWANASPQTRTSDPINTKPQPPPWFAQDRHGQTIAEGSSSQVPGAGSTNSQGFLYGEEHPEKMSAHPRAVSEAVGQCTPQTGSHHGLEPVAKHLSEENGVGSGTLLGHPHHVNFDGADGDEKQVPSVSATDFEAFGRSLKPSNLHPNYSSSSEVKQDLGSVSVPSTSISVNPYAIGDSNMQPIGSSSLPLMQNTAEENDMAFHRTDHSQVNMQMESWFKQYGALRNGPMLSMHDRTVKSSMNPSPLGMQTEILKMKAPMVPLDSQNEVRVPPPCTVQPNFGDTDLSTTRSRKRKTATSELLPWHMEVTQSSKRLQSINLAEMEWAKSVNRLVDKVDYGYQLLRPKKRLVLTTQLMQLVFMPAPATILCANTTSNYDSVAYFSAKLALGDACILNSWSINGSGLSCTSDNMMTEEPKRGEEIMKKHFSTIVEGFTGRAEKLEADFLRLDKTASVLDVTVEYKELEKFSLINRFAKFHVRGPQKAAETSISSGSTSSLLKPAPQRYVKAIRVKALPEKIKCMAI